MKKEKREVRLFIEDILDCVERIQQYTQGITKKEFLRDSQIHDAVLRCLEIIGEAVKRLPLPLRDRYPEIP